MHAHTVAASAHNHKANQMVKLSSNKASQSMAQRSNMTSDVMKREEATRWLRARVCVCLIQQRQKVGAIRSNEVSKRALINKPIFNAINECDVEIVNDFFFLYSNSFLFFTFCGLIDLRIEISYDTFHMFFLYLNLIKKLYLNLIKFLNSFL